MRTISGERFAAKVDVEGIGSAEELLRGLRAAYGHYTTDGSLAHGALITTVVHLNGSEVVLREDASPAEQPPLAALLPCSHIVMQGHQTATMAAQQLYMKANAAGAPGGAPHGGVHASGGAACGMGGGGMWPGCQVPRPANFVSLPVPEAARGGRRSAPPVRMVSDTAWQRQPPDGGCASQPSNSMSVGQLRAQFSQSGRTAGGTGQAVSELKAKFGAPKGRPQYR